MGKKQNQTRYVVYFASAIIILLIFFSWLAINNSYKNKEEAYLNRIPDRVSSKELAQQLTQIAKNVRFFKSSKSRLVEYPEHFNNHFTLIPYKESFGTNISYIPASSCLVFNSALSHSDALSIVEDITELGFNGGYIIDKQAIAKDLGGGSYKFYSFSKNNLKLTINNTDSEYKLPARACLDKN